MLVTTDQAYRAIAARDPRFDGYFVHAVRTTGIYCRPSCPARTPKPANSEFFPTTAAAQAAGYRACRRCLPDAVPGSPEWNLRADLAGRAMRLINDGSVERSGVHGLAAQLGYTARHLTRVLTAELGAGPLSLARARRAHTARTLIETTAMHFSDIAFAAGFASLRQFNGTIREVFAATPTSLREVARTRRGGAPPAGASAGVLSLRLPFRVPYDAAGVLRFLAARALAGVEDIGPGHHTRALRLPHGTGVATLRPGEDHVACTLRLTDLRDLGGAVSRLRRLLDLDTDPVAVADVLRTDPALAGSVARNPGVRVPGSVEETETLVRAVLGQQVSVAAARTAGERLAAELGDPLPHPDGGVRTLFPSAAALAEGAAKVLTGPRSRIDAVRRVAEAIEDGTLRIHPGRDADRLRADLRAVPGIGPWTADYVAMRVLGAPDVLLDGDLALRRGAVALGLPGTPSALRTRAERWSPWRSYAGMHLWQAAASGPCERNRS